MVKAGKLLKPFFKNMKHITCLAHALSLVSGEIQKFYSTTNQLIANMKAIFSKCTRRKLLFQSVTQIPLPPKVIPIRWGTWLDAAYIYNENFDEIKNFIDSHLENEDSEACETLVKLMKTNHLKLKKELLEIEKYRYITEGIKFFQSDDLTSDQQINKINEILNKLKCDNKLFYSKLNESLRKNPDFHGFNDVSQPQDMLNCQRYAKMTSVDVERSFSDFKQILKPQSQSLTMENLSMYTVVHYNEFLNSVNYV